MRIVFDILVAWASRPCIARRRHGRDGHATGFTLLELMISVALVLVLMLGVNYVFRESARTIGVGMALAQVTRDHRNARNMLEQDFDDIASAETMPAIIIHSQWRPAFKDKNDRVSDNDLDRLNNPIPLTIDLDADNIEGEDNVFGEDVDPNRIGHRSHRIDRLSFFTERLGLIEPYRRQTWNNTQFTDPSGRSQYAWITYGIAAQLRTGSFPNEFIAADDRSKYPDATLDPNYYALNWILNRRVILLANLGTSGGGERYGQASQIDLRPLEKDSTGTTKSGLVQDSVVDWADIPPVAATFTQPDQDTPVGRFREFVRNSAEEWWLPLDADWTPGPASSINYASAVRPIASGFARPDQVGQSTPQFLTGCVQFIVEHAGDYINQTGATDSAGIALPRDGIVDFDEPSPGEYRLRWYGMPRDVDGANEPLATRFEVNTLTEAANSETVVPEALKFEREAPAPLPFPYTDIHPDDKLPTPYIAAWGPEQLEAGWRPALLRITIVLQDPNGRLAEGQSVEYILPMYPTASP